MSFWITMAASFLLALDAWIIWRDRRELQERDRKIAALEKAKGEAEEKYRYLEETARWKAQLLDRAEEERDAARAAEELWKGDAKRLLEDMKAAELEAERCRKETAMHETERRELQARLEMLRDEYARLVQKETDAEALLRDEMANFLSYDGSGKGQRELKVDDDG